jgi:uncharacterized protein YndB with AHSA1/START domain
MEVQMPYTFTVTSIIPATPRQIYAAWLDSIEHSEMTGGEANMSDEIGAEVSAWDGYITGSNLELVPGERIVQAWRTSEFADEHADSVVTVTLEPVEEGTLLTLVHSNVPDSHRSYEDGGWEAQYFEPMKAYFARLEQEEAAEAPEPQELSQEAEPQEAAVVHIAIEEAPRPAPKKARKAKTKPAAPPAEVESAPPKAAKPPAAAKGRRKAAGAKKSARRTAPKRAAPKRAAVGKTTARKATSKKLGAKKAAAKKTAVNRSTARKAVGRKGAKKTAKKAAKKAVAKSKAGRRKAGRR